MLRVWVAAALTLAAAAVAEAQFGRGFFGSRVASEKDLTAASTIAVSSTVPA